MDNEKVQTRKTKKYMWYGWQKEAARHFGALPRSIEHWRNGKNRGLSVEMKRKELIEWCKLKLQNAGKTQDEIDNEIKEAFGEC